MARRASRTCTATRRSRTRAWVRLMRHSSGRSVYMYGRTARAPPPSMVWTVQAACVERSLCPSLLLRELR
eukprot:3267137-Prymnesium_polylepis.1